MSSLIYSAYEYLIKDFADSAGKKGGEFYTPSRVVRLLVNIIEPGESMSVYDPTCGSGGMLIQSRQFVEEMGGSPRLVPVFGQDNNGTVWSICKMNMILHNISDAHIENDDTLENPTFVEAGYIKQFDRVIANPPFSQNYSKAGMKFPQRFHYGFTPETGKKADLMFVQHMVASLKPDGKMATVMPHGVLFRGGAEKAIRQGMIDEGILEAVIGLPPNLFYGTGIPACVLVINKNRPADQKGHVLFINADAEFGEGRAQNFLRPEDLEKITQIYRQRRKLDRYSRLVPLEEIAANDYNLNIRRYIDNSPEPEIEDVRAHLVGGVPKREVARYAPDFARYCLDPADVFVESAGDPGHYYDFKPEIDSKTAIRNVIDCHAAVQALRQEMDTALHEWWVETAGDIIRLPGQNHLPQLRLDHIRTLKDKLLPLNALDEFQVAGIFVNWWEAVRYDLKTIVSSGWSKSLVSDEQILAAFFQYELAEIQSREGSAVHAEGELADLLNEVELEDEASEESAEETRKAADVKRYLGAQIAELKTLEKSESTLAEMGRLAEMVKGIEAKEKALKAARQAVNDKRRILKELLTLKRNSMTEDETRTLILQRLFEQANREMWRYFDLETRRINNRFGEFFEKYSYSLQQIDMNRQKTLNQINNVLTSLNYLK